MRQRGHVAEDALLQLRDVVSMERTERQERLQVTFRGPLYASRAAVCSCAHSSLRERRPASARGGMQRSAL